VKAAGGGAAHARLRTDLPSTLIEFVIGCGSSAQL
jgi:hypothetical protein